jgi:hypothetical protein
MPRKKFLVRLQLATILASLLLGATRLGAEDRTDSPATTTDVKPKRGKATGILTAKTAKDITVKAEGVQQTQRYRLAASEVQSAMKTVFVTNLVVVEWEGEQEPVVRSIHMILPKTKSGVSVGTVVAVDPNKDHFDLKPTGRGFTERYQPHYDMAAKRWEKIPGHDIAELKVGEKIKVSWVYDERKHPKQIQVIGSEKPTRSPKKGTE